MPDTMSSPSARTRTAFARKTPFGNQELSGLFMLLDGLPSDDTRITLSGLVRQKLRALFPRGSGETGVVDLANGLAVEVDLGDLFGAEFYVGHCNEHALLSALSASLPDGAHAIDVGANFGAYALHSTIAAGAGARVVAFEPAPTAYRLLLANTKRNGLGEQLKVRRAAVADVAGKIAFHVATDESFSGIRDTGRSPIVETVEIDTVALDEDDDVAALGPVDFLKIDTEGGEAAVLAGARNVIRRSPNLVILMEYSAKNLAPSHMRRVRRIVGELITEGMRAWSIGGRDSVNAIPAIGNLPKGFSGSILLSAPQATWGAKFLTAMAAINNAPTVAET
jgi:FkbM family methyltransferase